MLTRRIVARFLPATVSLKTNEITITSGAVAAALVALSLGLEAATLRIGIDDLDEGYFAQQALRVLHGQLPYRDFETLYSPGLLYVHAAIISLTGLPILGPRLMAMLARAGIAGLLFALARPLVRNPFWAAAPPLVLLFGLDEAPVRWEPHPGWLSTFFVLVAGWCLAHSSSTRWLIASGVAAAATFAFKQNTGLLILAAVLLWSRRRCLVPLSAFSMATLVWLLPLVASLGGDLGLLGVLVGRVNQAGLWSAPEVTILIPLACFAAGAWLSWRESDSRVRSLLLIGTALALTQFPRMDTTHLVWSAPLLLVLAAAALDRLPAKGSVIALTAVVVLLAPNAVFRWAYLWQPRTTVDSVEAPLVTASDLNAVVDDIRQRTRPGEPIFVYPTSPLLYVLADRPNPTRFDHLNPGAATRYQLDGVIEHIHAVHLVVVSDFWRAAWSEQGIADNVVLEEWLAAHFSEVARHGSYRVLVDNL